MTPLVVAAVDDALSTSELGVLVAILLTLAGTLGVAIRTYQESRAANRAVNHSEDSSEPSIRENVQYLVAKQRQFESKGWNSLPDDLGDAPALTETIRDLQHSSESNDEAHEAIFGMLSDQGEKIDTVIDELRAHDQWERGRRLPGGRRHDDPPTET